MRADFRVRNNAAVRPVFTLGKLIECAGFESHKQHGGLCFLFQLSLGHLCKTLRDDVDCATERDIRRLDRGTRGIECETGAFFHIVWFNRCTGSLSCGAKPRKSTTAGSGNAMSAPKRLRRIIVRRLNPDSRLASAKICAAATLLFSVPPTACRSSTSSTSAMSALPQCTTPKPTASSASVAPRPISRLLVRTEAMSLVSMGKSMYAAMAHTL